MGTPLTPEDHNLPFSCFLQQMNFSGLEVTPGDVSSQKPESEFLFVFDSHVSSVFNSLPVIRKFTTNPLTLRMMFVNSKLICIMLRLSVGECRGSIGLQFTQYCCICASVSACTSAQYQCQSNGFCVSIYNRCNGYCACSDCSDEINCSKH
jgi:hypothetical protein